MDGVTYREINKVLYCCLDAGCKDFAQAKRDRERVKGKEKTSAYHQVEHYLAHASLRWKLPSGIPQGDLSFVSRIDWQQFGGDRGGLHAVET